MSEINWSLAPEGAEEMVQYNEKLTWRKGIKIWCFVQSKWCDYVSGWKIIATRQQQKTVADAYEWAKGKWMEGKLAICELDGELYFSDNNLRMRNLVCTYEQFESYAKEQEAEITMDDINKHIDTGEQECEKWTHEFDNCKPRQLRIVCSEPDCNGEIVVLVDGPHGDLYCKVLPSKIKPIKPTLTKEQELAVIDFAEDVNEPHITILCEEYIARHEII